MRQILFIMMFNIITAVSFSSCSDESVTMSNESISEANLVTSKGIENAPAESGVYVIRYQLEGFLSYTLIDFKTQRMLTVNYPDQLPSYCGGGVPMDIINVQEIIAGSNEYHHTVFAEGEVGVKVYQGTHVYDNNVSRDENVAEFCSILANAPLLAEGTATVIYHDNDFYGSYSPNQTGIFGTSVQGQLTAPDGESKRLSAGVNFLWPEDAEDVNTILDVLINVTVRLN